MCLFLVLRDDTPDLMNNGSTPAKVAGGLFALSVPIIISQVAQMSGGFVDIVMAGRVDVTVLGSISVGASVATVTLTFLMGLLYIMVPVIGQLVGQGKSEQILTVFAKGLIVGFFVSAILGAFLYFFSHPVFEFMNVSSDLIGGADTYLKLAAFALPGIGVFLAVRFVVEASGSPLLVTATVVISVIIKVLANMAFVFGYFGMPALGVTGFGISTIITMWGSAVILIILSLTKANIRTLFKGKINEGELSTKNLLSFFLGGLPIAFNFLSEWLVMAVIALFIASISAVAVSSHQIAFNFILILMIIPGGISMAATIMVSKAVGASDKKMASRIVSLAVSEGVVISIVFAVITLIYSQEIASLYSTDEAVASSATQLLNVVALMLAVNAVVVALGFILRGLGDPAGPFFILLIAHWIFTIPLGYILSFKDWITQPLSTVGWWYGLFVGLILALVLMALRVKAVFNKMSEASN